MSVYAKNDISKMNQNDAWYKILKFLPASAKVLDIGCSSGNLGLAIKKQKKATVVGIDIDKADIELAKKNLDAAYILNVETEDLSKLGTFDAIIMADVIEHLIDPVAALKKIKKLLNKNGRLIFSIPNMANVTTRIELLKGKFEYKEFGLLDRTHLHFYDEQEVNRVFKASGLQVVTTDCTVREIPEPILRKDLEKIGVELTPKLLDHMRNTKAIIYQFIGYARVSASPQKFIGKTTSDLDSVSRQINQIQQSHQKELLQKHEEITNLATEVNKLRQENAHINQELNGILQSKGWRAMSKVYKVKNLLSKPLRKK